MLSLRQAQDKYWRSDGGASHPWPGFPFDGLRAGLESVYEEALAHEFDLRGIPYERQAKLAVRYKGIVAGEFRADFLVDGKVVVELKAIKTLTDGDEAQLLNYLKGTGYRVGLLLNFGAPSLEHKRRVL